VFHTITRLALLSYISLPWKKLPQFLHYCFLVFPRPWSPSIIERFPMFIDVS
jgi:hypothetical protein